MGGLTNLAAIPVENVVGTIEKNTPSLSCVVNQLEMPFRFNSFTCKGSDGVAEHISVSTYLACISSLLTLNITDIKSAEHCANVEYGPISTLLADCQWCTEKYGCFQVGGPFISLCHPFSFPPQPLSCLDLKLQLYTRLNPESPQLLNINLSNIVQTNFKKSLKTMVLIGGWQEGDFYPYDKLLINTALDFKDFNVILFNWNKGSGTLYGQSAANTRLLGRMLAHFLRDLQTQLNYPLADVHLVGHSLGAQLAGYAGKELGALGNYTVGRITGLDPAGPYYDCAEGPVRLDKSDATFVDVIHTNAGLFGDVVTNGDIDFWPNGGKHQPGCDLINLLLPQQFEDEFFCSHTRSVRLFASSMAPKSSDCSFEGYMSENYENFKADESNNCACAQMGYNASNYEGRLISNASTSISFERIGALSSNKHWSEGLTLLYNFG